MKKFWKIIKMLIHGKFINVVHPATINSQTTQNENKSSKNKHIETVVNDNSKIEKELKETKELLKILLDKVQEQPKTVIINQAQQKDTPAGSPRNDTDIFADVDIDVKQENKLSSNIKAKEEKMRKNVNDDIELLMNLKNK